MRIGFGLAENHCPASRISFTCFESYCDEFDEVVDSSTHVPEFCSVACFAVGFSGEGFLDLDFLRIFR